jgi:hypothetical protein
VVPSYEEIKAAGGSDVGDFGEANLHGLWAPGTVFDVNGVNVKPEGVENIVGSDGPGESEPSRRC